MVLWTYICGMHTELILNEDWSYLTSFLPPRSELDRSASSLGAIRRVREISCASDLLRLMMAYGFCGLSLRRTVAWAAEAGVANLSDVSLLERFRNGAKWLDHVLALKLADHAALDAARTPSCRVRLIDATTITRLGGRGTDWRLHLLIDLASTRIEQLEVTDSRGGEQLSRFKLRSGEIAVADAGYAHRSGLKSVLAQGADFLVRTNWSNLPLDTIQGDPVDIVACCREVADGHPSELTVRVRNTDSRPSRLLIARKTRAAAAESRRRKEAERSKKGQIDVRTLEAAEYVILLTSARPEDLSIEQAFEIYRFRWQIELVFKRLKSIINLDYLPAKGAALARLTLATKLLGALLVDDYIDRYVSFSPWGYRIRTEDSASSFDLAHRGSRH